MYGARVGVLCVVFSKEKSVTQHRHSMRDPVLRMQKGSGGQRERGQRDLPGTAVPTVSPALAQHLGN